MARIGLVLGAGGATGGAFHAGVLAALEEATGWDPRTADMILGTSAGSMTGAMLRAGFSGQPTSRPGPRARRSARREPPACDRPACRRGGTGRGPAPTATAARVRLGPSAPSVLWAAARRPWAVRPPAVMAGLMPEGTVPTTMISDGVGALLGDRWPPAPLWVAAVRLDDGRLVVFGRARGAGRHARARRWRRRAPFRAGSRRCGSAECATWTAAPTR